MKNLLRYLVIFFLLTFFNKNVFAENTYFIDYSKILNSSKAGAGAQEKLKKKLESESIKFKKEEENLKKLEEDLISQKKAISSLDYQKKVEDLRKKVSELQKNQQISLTNIAKSRAKAKQELQKILNPIIKKYMEQNNIRIILDKQSVVLGETSLELTDKIIEILNKELTSISID